MPSIALGTDDTEVKEIGEPDAAEERTIDTVSVDAVDVPVSPHRRIVFLGDALCARPDPRLFSVDAAACVFLRQLLAASGAELVLAMPWRRHSAYVREVLKNFGLFGEASEDEQATLESTPLFASAERRDLEILNWLGPRRSSVLSWVIIDSKDLLQLGPTAERLRDHFVRVPAGTAFGPDEVQAALKALGCEATLGCKPAAAHTGAEKTRWTSKPDSADGEPASFVSAFREANAWDEELSKKMESMLNILNGPGGQISEGHAPPSTPARESKPPARESKPSKKLIVEFEEGSDMRGAWSAGGEGRARSIASHAAVAPDFDAIFATARTKYGK